MFERALISVCAHKWLQIQNFYRYVTPTIHSCFFTTDEEAAASKRMVFYVLTKQNSILTSVFI